MKRKDLITKLVKEGLTEKTLVNMSDKQLRMLAERILKEQYSTYTTASTQTPSATSPSILNIPRTDQASINTAKQQKKTFATYEGEMKEGEKSKKHVHPKDKAQHNKDMEKFEDKKKKHSEVKEDLKLGAEKKEYSDKDKAIAAANMKIRAAIKDGKDYGDYTRLIKKLNSDKLPESTQKIIDGKKDIKEWVDKVVQKNVVPFTSKNEIMELINIKLTEQTKPWEDDDSDVDVMDAGQGAPQHAPMPKETEIEPDVVPKEPKTHPGVDPDDPFRDPHPGIDPGPKARNKEKISAREAKDKIIALMKQMLQ
jgi:hypothetical protein